MVVDLFLVFQFIKKLVTPFNKWPAFKLGIIDAKGNIIIRRKDFTKKEQSKAFGVFDQLVGNVKKLLAKLPGGSTRLASYAAALWLVKEQAALESNTTLNEELLIEEYLAEAESRFIYEWADIIEASEKEENSVGGGAIAGLGVGAQGEPGVSKKAQKKYKRKNFKDIAK
jgi:hypothetical protein